MKTKVAVIGNGGREHALAWKLAKSSHVEHVYLIPGNGVQEENITSTGISYGDLEAICEFYKKENLHYIIVGPEAPLSEGIVDELSKRDIRIFGPSKMASQMESSKVFSKGIMEEAGVPTAKSQTFSQSNEAVRWLSKHGAPVVIKADGLAAGKGVVVAMTLEEAHEAVLDCLENSAFGDSGSTILMEEYLEGREASVMAIISDGNICMLPISSDYKRVFDGQTGPNTGGMGAVSPTPILSEERLLEVRDTVFIPTINKLKEKGIPYSGFLYAGLMVHPDGSYKVIEFNARLGDPETQVLMQRIEDDLFEVMDNAINNPSKLPAVLKLSGMTALTVVLSSKGYPGKVYDGKVIEGINNVPEGITVFQAGTKKDGEKLISKGGRILTVTTTGTSIEETRTKVYAALKAISFEGMHHRNDIGL